MYVPKNFAMRDAETAAVLSEVGLTHLVTHDDDGYLVTPVPLLYRAATHTLVGHVSRANPHWQRSGPAVAIIPGPQAYISPSFYATKGETGKVVPTWNYEVVTVHGTLTAHDDADWVCGSSPNSRTGMSRTGIHPGESMMRQSHSPPRRYAPSSGSN
ncbi:Protease synthase and sporulation protein PAI 2 [Mycobacteroides salmoniphilum]|uniref:Protease synthase and sporulation protein PAI 2 n=1 Tax=Mycobacteroides salmoniphilum TaxID=404941 RepID=A0A4R8RYL9_9MYCO|nr:Protease synthase and sporulation protein PAI 2 [Mycobacteroides salmoniphilum]